jgi:hypothetical protein
MKKKLIAICLMFMFTIAMPAAQAVESPAYVITASAEVTTMQSEAIGKGKVTTSSQSINVGRPYSYEAKPAVVAASGGSCGSCYSSKGDVPGGVSGGGSIGIGKAAA